MCYIELPLLHLHLRPLFKLYIKYVLYRATIGTSTLEATVRALYYRCAISSYHCYIYTGGHCLSFILNMCYIELPLVHLHWRPLFELYIIDVLYRATIGTSTLEATVRALYYRCAISSYHWYIYTGGHCSSFIL